jgi:hypothetical protein
MAIHTCLVTYIYLVMYICPTKFSGVGFCPTKFKLCPTKIKSDRTNVSSSQIYICSPVRLKLNYPNHLFSSDFTLVSSHTINTPTHFAKISNNEHAECSLAEK